MASTLSFLLSPAENSVTFFSMDCEVSICSGFLLVSLFASPTTIVTFTIYKVTIFPRLLG